MYNICMDQSKVSIKAVARQTQNGYLFLPATPTDKRIMNEFCLSCGTGYVNLTVQQVRASKSYQQVKTFWALNDIAYQLENGGVRPTVAQAQCMYMTFLQMFADKMPSPIKGQPDIPISLSRMSKSQATRFIQSIMNFCLERMGDSVDSAIITDAKELFEELMSYRSSRDIDPIDTDEEGNWLSIDEWIARNPVSMANGESESVETHHMITKGSRPEFRYSVWNLVRLTHHQHIEMIHAKSEDEFLKIYPELKGRFERARRLASEYDKGNKSLAQPKRAETDDLIDSDGDISALADIAETVTFTPNPVNMQSLTDELADEFGDDSIKADMPLF